MNNPFEKPDESVEVDLSDLGGEEFGSGNKEFEPDEIAARHAELGKAYEADRQKEQRGYDAVAEAFFANNPGLAKRFESEPEAGQRFRSGLKSLIITSKVIYHCDPEDLPRIKGFRTDLLKFVDEFEEKEKIRKMTGRRAA